jgi:hypothetical protein
MAAPPPLRGPVVPPAAVVTVIPLAPPVANAPSAPLLTFTERYRDIRYDSEHNSYSWLLLNFDLMLPSTLSPQELWDSVLQEEVKNSRAIAVHWQDPAVPQDAGQIVVVHGIKRYPLSPGGTATPWDNKVYGWYQDVVGTNSP